MDCLIEATQCPNRNRPIWVVTKFDPVLRRTSESLILTLLPQPYLFTGLTGTWLYNGLTRLVGTEADEFSETYPRRRWFLSILCLLKAMIEMMPQWVNACTCDSAHLADTICNLHSKAHAIIIVNVPVFSGPENIIFVLLLLNDNFSFEVYWK